MSREEAARIELGHTRISRGTARFLAGIFLVTIFSVPAVQHIHEVREAFLDAVPAGSETSLWRYLPQCYDILKTLPDAQEVLSVRGARDLYNLLPGLKDLREYEDALEERSVVTGWLLPPAQVLLTGLLRAGSEEAVCGKEGWLFYVPSVKYLTHPGFLETALMTKRIEGSDSWEPPPQPDPVKAIAHFKDQLGSRGIELIVMPVPVKAMLYPERLTRRYQGSSKVLQNHSYENFKKRLESQGVLVCDVTDAFLEAKATEDGALYLRTDTHWTPRGAKLAAKELAGFIRSSVDLPSPEPLQHSQQEIELSNAGDIAVMLNLPGFPRIYDPQRVRMTQVRTEDNKLWQPDRRADILLLGDSYSNVYSLGGMNWGEGSGLAEHLSLALSRPLDCIRINAGGSHTTRQQLKKELARGEDRLYGKRLVIYQFTMRELLLGDWKILDLTLGDAPQPPEGSPDEGPGLPLVVRGRAAAASGAPRPGSVPYRDCITSLHIKDLEVLEGRLAAQEIVVYLWGMRDNQWTEGAFIREGTRLTLRLQPWKQAERLFGSYNRVELDDENLFLLDAYWGERADK